MTKVSASLPRHARLPINRCNLPAVILGSLSFQQQPMPLKLDGVAELHAQLFEALETIESISERVNNFKAYMCSSFMLGDLEAMGLGSEQPSENSSNRSQRGRADYLRMLRGWFFDPNSQEAAVLKSWVESRFGLLPRNHNGPLGDFSTDSYSDNYMAYMCDRAKGLYNTNALESQLDLLYSYCQYEVQRQYGQQSHMTLYRGTNRISEYETIARPDKYHYSLLLNNLNSFTDSRERADEFGDYILKAEIPCSKVLYMPNLLPGLLTGESEYLVIGGAYAVQLSYI